MIEKKIDPDEELVIPEGVITTEINGDTAIFYFADDADVADQNMLVHCREHAKCEIKKQCAAMITDGIPSAASGSLKKYRSKLEDQINIISASLSSKGATITNEEGKVKLDKSAVAILNADMVTVRESLLVEKNKRYADIDKAADKDSIDAVIRKKW